MKVPIGTFARTVIDSCLGGDPAGVARAAVLRYAGSLSDGRSPAAFPRFREPLEGGDRGSTTVELAIDGDTAVHLAREAQRQGISVEQIAAHAVLLYLAELDALFEDTGADRATEPPSSGV